MTEEKTTRRLFIALEMPDALGQELRERAGRLRKALDELPLRWVPDPNRHLTLRFLGDTPPETVEDIARAMDRVAAVHTPFPLRLTTPMAFPRLERPSVVWVGADGGEALLTLAAELPEALGQEPDAKAFVPHITVARVASRAGGKERRKIGAILKELPAEEPSSAGRVEGMCLFESRLNPSGAEYTRIQYSGFRIQD